MTKIRRIMAGALLALCPLLANAASAQAQLKTFVTGVKSAMGSFTQITVGPQGDTRPGQSGVFAFQRPGKFKWAVQRPYEQLIVSDGKTIFQYDPDLAQVSVQEVDQVIGTSPAAILFGSGNLDESFDVTTLPGKDSMDWLRAKPRNADAGFNYVDIGLKDNVPLRLELLDSFGQKTQIELSDIRSNPLLPATEFQFSPPTGTDVVRM
jgi:outer membrane lipoprotein carrier protein